MIMASAPCACRDCFDAASTDTDGTPTLCLLCDGAGCYIYPAAHLAEWLSSLSVKVTYECQRADAYVSEES